MSFKCINSVPKSKSLMDNLITWARKKTSPIGPWFNYISISLFILVHVNFSTSELLETQRNVSTENLEGNLEET